MSTLSHLKRGKHLHSRSISLLVVFSASISFLLTDNEALSRLLTILETVTTSDDGIPEPAAIVTVKNASVSAMKRSSAAGSSSSSAGQLESVMERVILPALRSVSSSNGGTMSSSYRSLFHKCAADLLRVGIETECLSRQRAAELLEKCIMSLLPSPETIEATLSSMSKMITSTTLSLSTEQGAKTNALMMTRMSELIHGEKGGVKGFLQPLAAAWMRPDFEVPRDLYISLAASYLLPAPNAPTSSNKWEWTKLGLSALAATPSTTTSVTMTPNILTGLAPFVNASQGTGSQLSSLVSMSGGPAISPPMSPLTSVSPANKRL